MILNSELYPSFLDHSVKMFLKILEEGEPHFIAEYNIQQVGRNILPAYIFLINFFTFR